LHFTYIPHNFPVQNNQNHKEMKAIVKVLRSSAYYDYNGRTFEVKELLSTLVGLDILGTTVDFLHTEVMIVDIDSEFQCEYDKFNWGSKNCYRNLESYASANAILYKRPEYRCPA